MAETPFFPDPSSYHVVSVFDPDGEGSDFAYTVGLDRVLGFELHAWARPPDGLDPGLDFVLSARDLHSLLCEAAVLVADGELAVDGRWEVELDAGAAQAVFRLTSPRGRDELDCFQARDGCSVASLRWSLEREPAGEAAGPDARGAAVIEERCERWLGVADELGADGVRLGAIADLAVGLDGAFGPATKAVLAASAAAAAVGMTSEGPWALGSGAVSAGRVPAWLSGRCAAEARPVGRSRWVQAAFELAGRDAHDMVGVAEGVDGDGELAGALERAVCEVLGCAYAALVLCDVVDEELEESATGVLEAVCDPERADARFWSHTERLGCLVERAGVLGEDEVCALASWVDDGGEELYTALDWARWQLAVSGRGWPRSGPEVFAVHALDGEVLSLAGEALDCAAVAVALAGLDRPEVALLAEVPFPGL